MRCLTELNARCDYEPLRNVIVWLYDAARCLVKNRFEMNLGIRSLTFNLLADIQQYQKVALKISIATLEKSTSITQWNDQLAYETNITY